MAWLHQDKDAAGPPLRLGLALDCPACAFTTDFCHLECLPQPLPILQGFSQNLLPLLCLPWQAKGFSGLELQVSFMCLSYVLYFTLYD